MLLFKAKHARLKDDADFARLLPLLDRDRRAWLRTVLTDVHPQHRWLDRLWYIGAISAMFGN